MHMLYCHVTIGFLDIFIFFYVFDDDTTSCTMDVKWFLQCFVFLFLSYIWQQVKLFTYSYFNLT